MRTLSVRGIEIVDDPSVPDGEIWLICPMQNGGKIRYMFSLTDHRMTQPGAEPGDPCFLSQLKQWLLDLEADMMDTDKEHLSLDRVALILQAITDFQTGKDARTSAGK